jgi:uncharacterized membrane protein/DNA-directed RNA polymerase subunit RPC12/RpoP
MTELLKCSSCGFTVEKGKLRGDVCPACGVSKELFEPFEPEVSESRRKWLDFKLHPQMVHFPEAFTIFTLILVLIAMIFPTFFPNQIICGIQILSVSIPIFGVFAILSGLFDAKKRLKRYTAPYVRIKIITGIVFLGLATTLGIFSFFMTAIGFGLIVMLILTIGAAICGGILGHIGGMLVEVIMK